MVDGVFLLLLLTWQVFDAPSDTAQPVTEVDMKRKGAWHVSGPFPFRE